MEDGARLPLRSWLPAEPPRATILAVHGLGLLNYRPSQGEIDRLTAQGAQ